MDDLRVASGRLEPAMLTGGRFAAALEKVGPDDLVFLDALHTVVRNHNDFVKYDDKLFPFDDQRRLSAAFDEVRDRGTYYIVTNAAHQFIAELFENGDRRIKTTRRNAAGGPGASRGMATERLFTSLPVA